jgi:hypothetical protein
VSLELDTSPAGRPAFAASYRFGDTIGSWEPLPGNVVTLRSGGVTILAELTEAMGRAYKGKVIGFERYDGCEYMGLKAGDSLAFTYANIFTCNR